MRTLLAFALPAMVANVLQVVNASVNAIWVSHLVGEAGLAAASNVNLVIGLIHSMTFGFGMAVTILIARSIGAGDIQGMRRNLGAGVGLFTAAGVGFSALGGFGVARILRALDVPLDAMPLALDYAHVMLVGLLPGLLFTFLQVAVRGTGDARTPLIFVIPAVLLDIVLNPLFILGYGPLPALGVAGSALASVVSSAAGLAMLVAYLYARDLPVRLRGAELRYLLPPLALAGTIVRQGVPMGLQMIIGSFSSLALMGFVNLEGTATVAAYAAIAQLWGYIQMPAMGLGGAASTMAAHNIGGNRWDRVDRLAFDAALLGFAITLVGVVLMLVFDRFALGLFFAQGNESLEIARHINHLATWSLVIFGAAIPLVVIPRANGANIAPLLIMSIMMLPGRAGFAWWLQPSWGADAIWWSFPVSYFVAGILIYGYYRYGGWRKLKVLPA